MAPWRAVKTGKICLQEPSLQELLIAYLKTFLSRINHLFFMTTQPELVDVYFRHRMVTALRLH